MHARRGGAEMGQDRIEQAGIELPPVEEPDGAALELRHAVDGAASRCNEDDCVAAQDHQGLPVLWSGIAANQGQLGLTRVEGCRRPETIRFVDRPDAHPGVLGLEKLGQGLGRLPVLLTGLRDRDVEREQSEQKMDERGDGGSPGDHAEGDDSRMRTPDDHRRTGLPNRNYNKRTLWRLPCRLKPRTAGRQRHRARSGGLDCEPEAGSRASP